ncbi:hypothetical protein AVEN_211407-1 [Araneus ventricosus]|uniref:Uncharacterized protein n=1 Tax=Araneus ventricosus TaxID=182803 RepID=A0A4Y2US31_ARAVE|nr:hypothetical protein AVEN_183524-1 [Araneus ventricosus]GBO15829.1 hypothetical protein AVEN_211407-1 [Araneus ventricosus]
MLTDERCHIRTLAARRIIKAREIGPDGNCVRSFVIPAVNIRATYNVDLIGWLIDIITNHLQSHDLGQRHNLVDRRLYSYCLKSLEVTFDNAFRPKLLPSRSEGSLGDFFPPIFDYLGVDKDMEVMFPKLSENKTGLFMVS